MKETENGKLIEIDDDDKYDITKQFSNQLQNDEFWYTLLVKNVEAKDYTNYHCVGSNKYGDGETTISLFGKHNTIFTAKGNKKLYVYCVQLCRFFFKVSNEYAYMKHLYHYFCGL